jgi:hypothetical protein
MKYAILIILALCTGCKSASISVSCKYKDIPIAISFKPEFENLK